MKRDEQGRRFRMQEIGMLKHSKHTKPMKVLLDPSPHILLDQNVPLRGWYKAKHEPNAVRPRPCYTEALLTSPYGGFCSVNCGHCYVNNGVRGYRSQGVTVVDIKYPDKVRRQLAKMQIGSAGYLSSFIDPFLDLEEVYHNTERTSQAFLDVGLPIFFLTRKKVPDWAFDHLQQNPHSYMQFSINTPSEDDWRRMSPGALPLPGMLEQLRRTHDAGIYTSIQVNPILAGITSNEDIVQLIQILADHGADHCIFKFTEIVFSSVSGLITKMRKRFGARADKFEALFTQNIGGVKSMEEDYRKRGLDMFAEACQKAGVTMALCYEYEYERDGEGNVVSKTGVNLGPKYMTSDQCHGRRVPMYVRRGERFEPLDVCPPAGCLTCADLNPGGVPCGDTRLGLAKALTPVDLKEFQGDV